MKMTTMIEASPMIDSLFRLNLYQYLPYLSERLLPDFMLFTTSPSQPNPWVKVPNDQINEDVGYSEHNSGHKDHGHDRVQVLAQHRIEAVSRKPWPVENQLYEECVPYLCRNVKRVDGDGRNERRLHEILQGDGPLRKAVGDLRES